jgi:hypothetical protein
MCASPGPDFRFVNTTESRCRILSVAESSPGPRCSMLFLSFSRKLAVPLVVVAAFAAAFVLWPRTPVRPASSLLHTQGTPASVQTILNTSFACDDWNTKQRADNSTEPACTDDAHASCYLGHCVHAYAYPQCVGGNCDAILTAANNSTGRGGKGFRHYVGDGFDVNGGGIRIQLPNAPLIEFWFRWYERWETGFTWSGGEPQFEKDWYVDPLASGTAAHAIGKTSGGAVYGTTMFSPSSANLYGGGASDGFGTWADINGGSSKGDGKFHCFEMHFKTDTNGSNGLFQLWISNRLVTDQHGLNWAQHGSSDVETDNQNSPANGHVSYRDYDDIAISTMGRIGCTWGR